ncbi:MAG: GNAT family N-acetyltransferase [Spirochaetales bacterium]|nr:GNAT family N-acetyltransferase [Spirochaetales bacterium]
MKYYKKIVGEKIYLSPVNPDDYEIYTKWLNDISLTKNLGAHRLLISEISEKEKLVEMSKSNTNDYAIVTKENDRLIGNCSLMNIDYINRTAEFGIFIGDEENRNRGLGTEAAKLLLEFGFRVLNLHNIMLRVFSFNEAAVKSYTKAGLKEFGRRTGSQILNGKYYDEIYMEALSDTFKSDYLLPVLPE